MELNLLKTATVTLRGTEFTLREISAVRMLDILERMQDADRVAQLRAQAELIEESTFVGGESIRGMMDQLPVDVHMNLMSEILALNKVEGKVGNEEASPQPA